MVLLICMWVLRPLFHYDSSLKQLSSNQNLQSYNQIESEKMHENTHDYRWDRLHICIQIGPCNVCWSFSDEERVDWMPSRYFWSHLRYFDKVKCYHALRSLPLSMSSFPNISCHCFLAYNTLKCYHHHSNLIEPCWTPLFPHLPIRVCSTSPLISSRAQTTREKLIAYRIATTRSRDIERFNAQKGLMVYSSSVVKVKSSKGGIGIYALTHHTSFGWQDLGTYLVQC